MHLSFEYPRGAAPAAQKKDPACRSRGFFPPKSFVRPLPPSDSLTVVSCRSVRNTPNVAARVIPLDTV